MNRSATFGVLGGSGSTGKAVAKELRSSTNRAILIGGRNVANLKTVAADLGAAVSAARVDVRDPRSLEEFCGRCSVVVNCGGALGIGVAYAGTKLILHLAFQIGGSNNSNNYVPISATPSLPVLLFTLGASVLTGIIFGFVPAWITSHADPIEALRGASRSVAGGRDCPREDLARS